VVGFGTNAVLRPSSAVFSVADDIKSQPFGSAFWGDNRHIHPQTSRHKKGSRRSSKIGKDAPGLAKGDYRLSEEAIGLNGPIHVKESEE